MSSSSRWGTVPESFGSATASTAKLVHQLVVVRPAFGQQPDRHALQPDLVGLLVGGAAAVVAAERGGLAGAHKSTASQSMPTRPAQGPWPPSSVNCTVRGQKTSTSSSSKRGRPARTSPPWCRAVGPVAVDDTVSAYWSPGCR